MGFSYPEALVALWKALLPLLWALMAPRRLLFVPLEHEEGNAQDQCMLG